MEKKKLKLTISEGSKKTINNIELAKSKANNSVVIKKKNTRSKTRSSFSNTNNQNKSKSHFTPRAPNVSKTSGINDYEKRKLAEQRATKRLRGENAQKSKIGSNIKRRELKLTVSRALSDKDIEFKGRSLASLKRAKQKENQKNQKQEELKPVKRDVNIPEAITIRELANRMAEQSSNIIKHLLSMGVTATINHSINSDIAEYLVQEFGHNPIKEKKAEEIIKKIKEIKSQNLKNRPPIITVMGHVDHGKTSLLDVLRKANVVSGEFGGITQHLGSYQINYNSNKITFIDTPGHAAFTKMRARGSKLTDIVILVVAADDGVKPQTIESIKHAKAGKVPIVVALNKCDLPESDPQKVRNQLLEHELISEELSGDTLIVEISAKTKKNIDKLIESVLLQAELLELKADYGLKANGVVLESKIDTGRGPIVNIIVTSGTLKKGDYFVSGLKWGKVRALINDKGNNIEEATPSTPVEVLGINGAAKAGDDFVVLDSEKEAKSLCSARIQENQQGKNPLTFVTQDSAFKDKTTEELNIIIKSDVHGSSEAIKNAITQIKHEEVKPKIILSDIGMITETDVSLAKASNALLIAFNVKPSKEAKQTAEKEKIKINSFNIIYELLEFTKNKMSGMLAPDVEEKIIGSAEILEIFKVSKVGKVAGSKVIEGEILQDSSARIIRDGVIIFNGKIGSIFREKNQAKQVSAGLECGITIKNFNDFQKKDIIEVFNSTITEKSI
jgi:translation initiation factor IF-2